ncbi:MAG: DUF4918 family protein [Cyclobacteriaceae bacterium]|nr:DUF4918 family protein [Cyclobacteriaceae bacterium]
MTFAAKHLQFIKKLKNPPLLPQDVEVLNPWGQAEVWELNTSFYEKYYHDNRDRIIILGINPGRYGAGVTGIPFTDPVHLEKKCGIVNFLDKRTELSSTFIYQLIESMGTVSDFYHKYYFSAVSPLGYVRNGKNLNYYDIPAWRDVFLNYITQCIEDQLEIGILRDIAFCLGQGKNFAFLNQLNEEKGYFKKLVPLPHPRWVMQYRLKKKDLYLHEITQKLNSV